MLFLLVILNISIQQTLCDWRFVQILDGLILQIKNDLSLAHVQIVTNDESAITNSTVNQDQFQNVQIVNQLWFWAKNQQNYLLPFSSNTFKRRMTYNVYDKDNNLVNYGSFRSFIKILNVQQRLIDGSFRSKQLSIVANTYKQFKIVNDSNEDYYFQIQVQIGNNLIQQPQNMFNLLVDGQQINSFQSCQSNMLFSICQCFKQTDFPQQFKNLEFVFQQYLISSIQIKMQLYNQVSSFESIDISTFNQFYSVQYLLSNDMQALVRPSSLGKLLAYELAFNLNFTIFVNCDLYQIILPPSISQQFTKAAPTLMAQFQTNSNFTEQVTDYYNNGTLILQKSLSFKSSNTLNNIQILIQQFEFQDQIDDNSSSSIVFNCSQNNLFVKNFTISKIQLPNANLTQTQIVLNNTDIPTLNIIIQIPPINILSSVLTLELPNGVQCLNQSQTNILTNGFVYSQYQSIDNSISFLSTNFTSASISITFTKVNKIDGNQNLTKINVKCIFNSTVLFYVDANTQQTITIIQPPSPPPQTQIQINSFNQTSFSSLSIYENRTSVLSQLAFSFSILKFLETCSWLIVSLPLEFTTSFQQNSSFNLFGCHGNNYQYTQVNPLSAQSVIGYTQNNNCIYISCLALQQFSQLNNNNNNNYCLNNTVTIQNVKSYDLATQTQGLKIFVANRNSSNKQDLNPPTFFSENLDLNNNSLPYYFTNSEVSTYQGINLTEVDLSYLAFNTISTYLRDIFNFTMTFSYPIYLWEKHHLNIQLPYQFLGSNNITCQPASFVQCSLQMGTQQNYSTLNLLILQQVLPDTKITIEVYQVVVVAENTIQQKQAVIKLFLENRLINTKSKIIDVLSDLMPQNFIVFSTSSPLQLSNSLLGLSDVNYTFFIKQMNLPPKINDNYYLSLTLDQSFLLVSNNYNCSILTQGENQIYLEQQLKCLFYFPNNFIFSISSFAIMSQPFQLRISGLRNPSGIVEQNEQNVAQTYNFQLIWSTQQGNSFKNVWLIQSVSLPITSKYTCSPNCQACASNYAACTACAPGYLKSQYNHHAVLACLPTCSPQYVAYNGTCLACQLKDPQCLSCSPSNLTQCSSCNQGYTLVPEFNGCVDSHLLQTARSRLLDYSLSTNLADNIDTTHPDDAQKSDKAQSLTRMTEESSSAKADQREGGESSSNTGSKVMGQLQDTVGALKGGGAIFIWIVLAALAVSVSQSVLRYTYNKLKGKSHSNGSSSGMRRSSSGSRSSSSGSSSAGRNASGKEHKGVREREKELRGQRIDCLMLFLLSVAEAIQMPYTLLWGFSVSGGDFESPVLQTLLGACALSTLLWIFDAYLLGSILANSENTPKTSCLLNPLPSSKREGCLSFLIVPARLAFCLIPKSVSLTLTNIFSVEGWFRYPYGEDVERATIVLTNFRKVLSSQIKSNVSGLCSLVSFLILQYPEVLSSYVQIYDLIIFDIVMTILCLTNIRNVDKLISTLNQIQESEGEL
ncbi:transmembrane protein, putative (macronuclear) [Tetrahymena thermophila SB210]|uniref:Transmembrane protein, putative n=1 Tax=Tetrahymena thermophila (strain SB210) TaxID=312017 RepID=Q23M85_TETTS|nr:transmembrane protein, putative [Tetrahymena thermophila SB210]EAR97628.2 transmembrane protein, putative [Tetrahymena thermophila SB210]|eukprot:XP_001017873.2 transmembrane protein, putative [Tetrahymena thermophila SB210]